MNIRRRTRLLAVAALLALPAAATALGGDVLDPADKQAILDHMNAQRAQVARGDVSGQPSAADMNELIWDEGLAAVASNYAATCPATHNADRSTQVAGEATSFQQPASIYVGENLYFHSQGATLPLLLGGVDAWFDEHAVYTYSDTYDPSAGHYTQQVWANTRYVGCGYRSNPACTWQTTLVCNYYPGGNFGSVFPYENGAAATNCDDDRTPVDDGLCGGGVHSGYNIVAQSAVDDCGDGTGRDNCVAAAFGNTPPSAVRYQGQLTDSGGAPVDGSVDVVVSIFDAETGGTEVYGEDHEAVPVQNGLMAFWIGGGARNVGTFDAATLSSGARWLELAIDGETQAPRLPLGSAPYSMVSGEAVVGGGGAPGTDTLASLSCAIGEVAKWDGAAWACAPDVDTDTTIPDTDTLAGLSCSTGQVAKRAGSSWICAADENDDRLAQLTCNAGEVAKWSSGEWACAVDIDTDTDTDTSAATQCSGTGTYLDGDGACDVGVQDVACTDCVDSNDVADGSITEEDLDTPVTGSGTATTATDIRRFFISASVDVERVRVKLVCNGNSEGDAATVTVLLSGIEVASYVCGAGGNRPWTWFSPEIDTTGSTNIDVRYALLAPGGRFYWREVSIVPISPASVYNVSTGTKTVTDTDPTDCASVTLTPPASGGYVEVTASGQLYNLSGTEEVRASLSETSATHEFDHEQNMFFLVSNAAARLPLHVSQEYDNASTATRTYYLVVDNTNGPENFVCAVRLRAQWFAGTMSP